MNQDSEIVQNWKYLVNKQVHQKGARLSADNSYILIGKGKNERILARHITRHHECRNIGLFWYGWMHQLERIQSLLEHLRKRRTKFFAEKMEPFILELLGSRKSCTVWMTDPKRKESDCRIFGYQIEKRVPDYYFQRRYPKGHPYREQKYVLSWSAQHIGEVGKRFHSSQLPRPTAEGAKLKKMIEYQDDLWRRIHLAEQYLALGIEKRLQTISENYGTGDMVRFKIGDQTYIYHKTKDHGAWEMAGKLHEVELYSVEPQVPGWLEHWKYAHRFA